MAGIEEGSRVLDLAAGSGGQSVAAARVVGSSGHVLATDLSPNIISLAARRMLEEGITNVDTAVMDGEEIKLPEGSIDAVISRLGIMFFPHLDRCLAGAYAALKPSGRFAALVFTSPERNAFFSTPVAIARRHAGLPPPAPGQPGPFSLSDPTRFKEASAHAGFREVRCETVSAPLRLSSAAECLRFEREAFGALHQMLANLGPEGEEAAWLEIGAALEEFEGESGFEAPCELRICVAEK